MKRVSTKAPARPTRDARERHRHAVADDQAQDGLRRRAERQPDAELARALAHQIRHHAVDADGRERRARAPQTASSSSIENRRRASDSSTRCVIVRTL